MARFRTPAILIATLSVLTHIIWAQPVELPQFRDLYLGQMPPGDSPVKFAPGIVSTPEMEYRLVISPTGEDIFFCREASIMHIGMNPSKTGWEGPTTASFSGEYTDSETWFSADGRKLYFTSRRPMLNSVSVRNLWVTEKTGGTWSTPRPVPLPPTEHSVHAVSVAANGNLYASGIIRSSYDSGQYRTWQQLTPSIRGSHPCIAPDESLLIFDDRRVGGFDSDLYITFSKGDGTWTSRLSLGDRINTDRKESNASLSPDGMYLFFSRAEDIFWVKADFIDSLKTQALGR